MQNSKSILKNIFGYESFRPLQHEIILNILNKKDTLVVMPTGGGKSLCYQIPALIFEGLTIVVSPLISLMKDQVEQLRELGVEAAMLNSSLLPSEYNENYNKVSAGIAKLLYLAPESLSKSDVVNLLKHAKLDFITVDEAHCISEWGHDFRPDYRQLGLIRKIFPDAVCSALTATATPRVQNDIVKNLNLVNSTKFIASFNRPNLFLQVINKINPFEQTVDFLKEHKDQSGIIYCFSRRQVDKLNEELSAIGFSTKPYHAGLPDEERNRNQDLFIKDEVQIIVATIAFGMGINKSNVRFVLHHDLPKNLESYYQEIGRAGRDGLRADCLLLFSYADISKINYFIEQKEDPVEKESAKVHLKAMVRYAESEVCRRKPLINYFGEKYHTDNCNTCDNCTVERTDLEDITIPAQKFLSAVKRTGEIFGANYIIDVLTGAESHRIFSNGHQKLTVYGIGKEYTKKQWQYFARQFAAKEVIVRDPEFGSVKLTDKAALVLFRSEKVMGMIKEPEGITKRKKIADEGYDRELFEILRKKRKEIAERKNIPPYVIFSDRTLIHMASVYPRIESEMLNISGIGYTKLKKYGDIFLNLIRDYCSRKKIFVPSKKGISKKKSVVNQKKRYEEVAEAFNGGQTIIELAERYNVKPQTIINHLFRYASEGNDIMSDYLISQISADAQLREKVLNEFKFTGELRVKPLYERFNGEVSYEDLHLMKIIFMCEYADKN